MCFPCTHCVWVARGRDAHLKARSVSRPADAVGKLQTKTPAVAAGCSCRLLTLASFGAFLPQLLWGLQAFRADGSCMKRMSHGCILLTRGPSPKPGALPPLSLVFILGSPWDPENRQDSRGCVNSASPHRTQFAIAGLIKYRTLSHHNALLAAFPGKF